MAKIMLSFSDAIRSAILIGSDPNKRPRGDERTSLPCRRCYLVNETTVICGGVGDRPGDTARAGVTWAKDTSESQAHLGLGCVADRS
jgi:hypothetical protein